jgi:hypothetical protein
MAQASLPFVMMMGRGLKCAPGICSLVYTPFHITIVVRRGRLKMLTFQYINMLIYLGPILFRAEEGVNVVAMDSHPTRTNGFLTGCLINVLDDYKGASIDDLPR